MMVIENKYNIGDYVSLTTDPDGNRRIVTAIKIVSDLGLIVYELSYGADVSSHYEFEINNVEEYIIK